MTALVHLAGEFEAPDRVATGALKHLTSTTTSLVPRLFIARGKKVHEIESILLLPGQQPESEHAQF